MSSNKLLHDTLYGGINGELYQPDIKYQEPDINIQDSSPLPDSEQSPKQSEITKIEDYEIIQPNEVFAASIEERL